MKYLFIFFTAGFWLGNQAPAQAQEPFDARGQKEEIEKLYQERHYPIKITFRVVDESVAPVAGADVDVGIDSLLHVDGYNNYVGKTDSKGLFTVESRGRGCAQVVISREGYYPSRPEVKWDGERNPGGPDMQKNGFHPWNPTFDVVLKKVGKPIPMVVRLGSLHFTPRLGEEVGFDLLIGDWVKPKGKGELSDLLIRFESNFVAENDFETNMTVRFSNPNDGFHSIDALFGEESLLKYPRVASGNEYPTKHLSLKVGSSDAGEQKGPAGYIFRIRSVLDQKTHEVVSALYGKIVNNKRESGGPVKLVPYMWINKSVDSTPGFQFSYCLNPVPNDRNLEYNQRHNLAADAEKGVTYDP